MRNAPLLDLQDAVALSHDTVADPAVRPFRNGPRFPVRRALQQSRRLLVRSDAASGLLPECRTAPLAASAREVEEERCAPRPRLGARLPRWRQAPEGRKARGEGTPDRAPCNQD